VCIVLRLCRKSLYTRGGAQQIGVRKSDTVSSSEGRGYKNYKKYIIIVKKYICIFI